MNCREFTDLLPQYLDEELDDSLMAGSKQHLSQCCTCQLALRREQAVGRALQCALSGTADEISLQSESLNPILRAELSLDARTAGFGTCRRFIFSPFGIAGAVAALVAVPILGTKFVRPVQTMPSASPNFVEGLGGYSIDVPSRYEIHFFKMRNGAVLDALIANTSVAHAQFPALALPPQ